MAPSRPSTTPGLSASAPAALHDLLKLRINLGTRHVGSDGRLIGLQWAESEDSLGSINVVLHWADTVRRRLSRDGR